MSSRRIKNNSCVYNFTIVRMYQKENTGQFLFNIWVTWYWVLWGTLKIRECPQRDVIKSILTAGSYLAFCEHWDHLHISNCANLRYCDHFAYLVNIVHIWWTLCIYGEHFANHKYLVDCSAVCRVRRLNSEVEQGASRGLAPQTRPFVKRRFCSGNWEKNQSEIFIQAALEHLAKKSYNSTLQVKRQSSSFNMQFSLVRV